MRSKVIVLSHDRRIYGLIDGLLQFQSWNSHFSFQAERAERERDEGGLPAEALATDEARPHAADVDDQVQVGEDGAPPREEGQVDKGGEGEALSVETFHLVCQLIHSDIYRVTIPLVQNLPLTSKQKFRFCLAWPGQNGTFVLKSRGGFEQVEWLPQSGNPCPTTFANEQKLQNLDEKLV